jgi:hypothetical protein
MRLEMFATRAQGGRAKKSDLFVQNKTKNKKNQEKKHKRIRIRSPEHNETVLNREEGVITNRKMTYHCTTI